MRCLALVFASSISRETLISLAEMGLAFGATTSWNPETSTVWIDITGCAHLWPVEASPTGQSEPTTEEERLASALLQQIHAAYGLAPRLAISDGPRLAQAIARFTQAQMTFVPQGHGGEALAALPLAALPLPERDFTWLKRLGMDRAGDLRSLPPDSLGSRIDPNAMHAIRLLLDGIDPMPLARHVPPSIPEETVELEDGTEASDALVFVMRPLCERLMLRLTSRGFSVTEVALVLSLDRALRPAQAELTLPITLAEPIVEAASLIHVLRTKVATLNLDAPVRKVRLCALLYGKHQPSQRHLFHAEPRHQRVLPALLAELEAELGSGAVGRLALQDTWHPLQRSALVPFRSPEGPLAHWAGSHPDAPPALLLDTVEPSRVLSTPLTTELTCAQHVATLTPEPWWLARVARAPLQIHIAWAPAFQTYAWVLSHNHHHEVWGWID